MSDLHLSLIGMGALLVAGVIAYNKLQERKYRKQMEQAFAGAEADPLLPAVTEEDEDDADTPAWARADMPPAVPELVASADITPALEAAPAPPAATPFVPPADTTRFEALRVEPGIAPAPADNFNERREPVFSEPAFTPPETEESPPPAPRGMVNVEPSTMPAAPDVSSTPPSTAAPGSSSLPPVDWCDSSIDTLVRLDFDVPLSHEELCVSHTTMQAQLRLPLRAYVQLLSGSWQPLADVMGGEFKTVCLALQLVDRHGPVTKAELDSLHNSVMGLCHLRNGHSLFPNISDAAAQASALDEFCAQLDLQLAMNVLDSGKGAFPGTKIRGLAEAAGMQLASNGEFHAFDDNGNFLFAMANMGEGFDVQSLRTMQTHGLTFFLDVPHVFDGGYAFERMLSTAKQCANALGGNLVNTQRAVIGDTMVDGIRKKIFEIHEQMQIAGIPSGGARALRLFS